MLKLKPKRLVDRLKTALLGSPDEARWKALKVESSGILSAAVYRELYCLARDAPDLDIIEIGGAAGAGNIALAVSTRTTQLHSKEMWRVTWQASGSVR